MSFGLATAPATFMQLMTMVLLEVLYTTCLVSFKDIIVLGCNCIEMSCRHDAAIKRYKQANLKLKLS